MQNKKLRPAFKIHGGKFYLSEWVIDNFPKDYQKYHYVEPYLGAGSVLLNKLPADDGQLEVGNDINIGVVQIFRALRDEPEHFIKSLKRITYSENVFGRELKRQKNEFEDYMDHAISEFITRRMSRGGLKKAFGWSDRTRGGVPGDVNAWKTILELLPAIAERVKNIHLFNTSAPKIIDAFDSDNTLIYCDPPYLPDTRTSPDCYENEMTTDDHIELSKSLLRARGKVVLSGYPSALYNRIYADWRCEKKKIANHSSQEKVKQQKTECLWFNF